MISAALLTRHLVKAGKKGPELQTRCSASRNGARLPSNERAGWAHTVLAWSPASENGKGSEQEEATPISMHYTAFCKMNIKHLCFLFV